MVEYAAKRSPHRRPTHPGAILKHDVLPALGMPRKQFAEHLGISRQTLYQILNEERPVTPDVAARLARAFGNGARFWLALQANYDAWGAELAASKMKIERLHERVGDGQTG
jgi:addiction module HigA family antidote